MADKIEGFLEVGCNEKDEIVINVPPLKKAQDEHGMNCAYRLDNEERCNCGAEYQHIVFSPRQARNLAQLLLDNAGSAEREINRKKEGLRIASLPPVDRTARVLTDGSPVTDDHRELLPSGQQKGYVVLSAEERSKGFVRPVRRSYRHNTCKVVTSMGLALAETYARDPQFYSGTFCVHCSGHFPLDQFVWEGTDEILGS